MSKPFRVAVIGSTGRGNYGHGLDTAFLNVERARVVAVADDGLVSGWAWTVCIVTIAIC